MEIGIDSHVVYYDIKKTVSKPLQTKYISLRSCKNMFPGF